MKPNHEAEEYKLAKENGCNPVWYDGIIGWDWHCGCEVMRHAHDQQCSVITKESAKR